MAKRFQRRRSDALRHSHETAIPNISPEAASEADLLFSWDQGYEANRKGFSLEYNPYSDSEMREAWKEGWLAAEDIFAEMQTDWGRLEEQAQKAITEQIVHSLIGLRLTKPPKDK